MTRIYIFSFFLLALTCMGFGQQSGTLIVLNKSSHTVNFINLDTDAVVAELQTGQNPHEVAVNPSGTLAVVTNYGTGQQRGNSLTVIDIPNRKVVRTIELTYTAPHGIEFFDSNRVIVTSETSQNLLVVDIASGKIDQVIHTGQEISHMVSYAPKSKRAFVANIGSGSVSVIDMVNFALEKIIKTGQGAEGVAVSPDGSRLWITNRSGNTVTVLDVASLQLLKTIPSEKFPIRVKFTQKNHLALVSNAETGTVNIYDAREGELLKTISMEATSVEKEPGRLFQDFENSPVPVGILVHPSDRFAYVANTNADVITVIDLETFQIIKRLKAGKEPDGLGFTPLSF